MAAGSPQSLHASASAVSQIETLDAAVFSIQPGHYADRVSFLRVQRLIRRLRPGYCYLEIGSDIGGSLLPHLLDPACAAAVSIDPRPALQADERGVDFHYVGNSTARMLEALQRCDADLDKLATIEADASSIDPSVLGRKADLVLIDGEHTNTASFSDFLAVCGMIHSDAIVTFHDANLIGDTLQIVERLLASQGTAYSLAILPSCVAVFGFGSFVAPVTDELGPHAEAKSTYYAAARGRRHEAVADAVVAKAPQAKARNIAELLALVGKLEHDVATSDAVSTELAQLRSAWTETQAAYAVLQRRADMLERSTCWRITGPMRAAVDWVRRSRQ